MKLRQFGLVFMAIFTLVGCGGGNRSAVEGTIVDWNDKPVAHVDIMASPVYPVKGDSHLFATTNLEGVFRIEGLSPSTPYVLKPYSDKWTCETHARFDSPQKRKTHTLSNPIKIDAAFSKKGGAPIFDLTTGVTRFVVSHEGMILDNKTGLEWIDGPDHNGSYHDAERWVLNCKIAGGNWRMPTRSELATLYQIKAGPFNIDPVFGVNDWYVWAEPRDGHAGYAWGFDFNYGQEYFNPKATFFNKTGILAVRSR